MFEDAISMLSLFGSMNTWLTPMVLFVVLNLMIGIIAFTSHKPNHNHNHHNNHLHNHHFHQPQPPLQTTLTRSPSVLQRLKSTINFSSFYTHHYHHQPSSTTTTTYFQPPQPNSEPKLQPDPEPEPIISNEVEEAEEDEGPTLDEVYSRIKQASINPLYGRQNSDTKPSNGEIPVKLPQKMKKSASDKSAFDHFELHNVHVGSGGATIMEDHDDDVDIRDQYEAEEEVQEEGVDAKADDFINKFKKQLQLQRKESILRYNQMIHSRT